MVFSDPVFIFLFLPLCVVAYLALGGKFRLLVVNVIGLIFYTWDGGSFVNLILIQTLLTFVFGILVGKSRGKRNASLAILSLGIALNLGSLLYFKYAGFGIEIFNSLASKFGISEVGPVNHLLPLGISFFTFQFLSYLIDIYRGVSSPAPELRKFFAYILLFPHLIAGPIVRYAEINSELVSAKRNRLQDVSDGFPRFFWGLSKKILIADQAANISNLIFGLPDNRITFATAWIAAITYSIQIYFDFSGYSDMAIGLARMLGFTFPENFDRPYSAVSVTDFWRRWHITLSRWFRDYVYFPLGGNRKGKYKTYRNLSIVFLLTGIWHGANWTFLVWGAFHGGLLILERITNAGGGSTSRFWVVRRFSTYLLVCIGWVIFRSESITQSAVFIRAMFSPTSIEVSNEVMNVLTLQHLLWTFIGLFSVLLPHRVRVGKWLSYSDSKFSGVTRLLVVALPGTLSLIYAMSGTFSPFLYFQF